MATRTPKAQRLSEAQTKDGRIGEVIPSEMPVAPKSLIEQAQIASPHANGWDKTAAMGLAREFATVTKSLTVEQMMVLANLYKNYAGWGNLMDALAELHCGKKLKV